jgi:F0F1-type ATP synthase assembly protein I
MTTGVTINCSALTSDTFGFCGLLEGFGAGLGVFMQYLAIAVPYLLLVIGIVGVVLGIGGAIAYVIKHAIQSVKTD